ncbi:unnamed protein product [Effrenium voratum]|nr:unnamed protein product [Effrenium voratum]
MTVKEGRSRPGPRVPLAPLLADHRRGLSGIRGHGPGVCASGVGPQDIGSHRCGGHGAGVCNVPALDVGAHPQLPPQPHRGGVAGEYILHLDSSAVCWCFPALWLQICLAFPETVDPPMDAWTAATARSMCGAGCSHIFQESWADVPFIGEFLGWMGLSGILTTLLCLSTMFQLVSVLLQTWGCLQKIDNMRDCAPYKHADDGAYRRWAVWVRMHHIADLGGFILLQKTYEKLVVVETQRSARIWPVADRNASFRAKICAESLPALWFQVSVFCLNFETASRVNLGTTLFSIVTGALSILMQLQELPGAPCSRLWRVMSFCVTGFCFARGPRSFCLRVLFGYWALGFAPATS